MPRGRRTKEGESSTTRTSRTTSTNNPRRAYRREKNQDLGPRKPTTNPCLEDRRTSNTTRIRTKEMREDTRQEM